MIISTEYLRLRLPGSDNENDNITDAVSQANSALNGACVKYHPFTFWDTATNAATAPCVIVQKTLELAKLIYKRNTGDVETGDDAQETYRVREEELLKQLKKIEVPPSEETQTVSLVDDKMLLGTWTAEAGYVQAIPFGAYIMGGASKWINKVDFKIVRGDELDEIPDAWYLYQLKSGVDGTLHYKRTYRNDGIDYMKAYHG